jgi:ERCC4-related helicase
MLPRPRELRAYQRELLEHTRREHVVAALPTGAGKTLVAFALAAELLRTQRDEFKAVFLAPTVPLVVQQQRVFATEAEREGLVMRTAPFFGMPDPTDRRLLLAGLQSGKLPLYLFRVVREISELIGSGRCAFDLMRSC